MFPKQIRFISDDTEANFKEVLTHDGRTKLSEPKGMYIYTKSKWKMGFEIGFNKTELSKLLKEKIISVLTQ